MASAFILWFFAAQVVGTDLEWTQVGYFSNKLACETYRAAMMQKHVAFGVEMKTQPCRRVWSDQMEQQG